MTEETRSIGPICADLKAKGEHEAAETIERIADSNAELGDNNIVLDRMVAELLDVLENAVFWDSHDHDGYPAPWLRNAERAIAKVKGETG